MMEVIVKDFIFLDTDLHTQDEVFQFLTKALTSCGRADQGDIIIEGFYQREKEFSTAMNDGIAIPHCRSKAIQDATVIIVRNQSMITWTDQEEVDLFFALMIPEANENQMHIRILAQVAQLIMEDDFIDIVRHSKDPEVIYKEMEKLNTLL